MNMDEAKKFILPIVQDFDIFAEYIKKEKPVLTPSGKIINRKDCYTINDKLSFKTEVDAPKYNQEKYTIIDAPGGSSPHRPRPSPATRRSTRR